MAAPAFKTVAVSPWPRRPSRWPIWIRAPVRRPRRRPKIVDAHDRCAERPPRGGRRRSSCPSLMRGVELPVPSSRGRRAPPAQRAGGSRWSPGLLAGAEIAIRSRRVQLRSAATARGPALRLRPGRRRRVGLAADVNLQADLQRRQPLGALRRQPLGGLQPVDRMHPAQLPGHRAGLVRLQRSDQGCHSRSARRSASAAILSSPSWT